MERKIKEFLKEREKQGLLRSLNVVSSRNKGRIRIDEKEYIDLSSNDYLGLSSHPEIISKARQAAFIGSGTAASRLMAGTTSLHHELEERVAEFKKKPAALIFNSGYQANVGIISALVGKGDTVFSDRFNHASIIDGIRLSGAKLFRFRHNDAEHLKELLEKERHNYASSLIVTETVFSMDGDTSPIKEIVDLKEKYDSMVMVDEAHATGIFGKNGTGLTEKENVTDKVDIIMGTFSKALGSFGAYAAMSGRLKKYLVNTCRSLIYSTALPPAVIVSNLAALKIVKTEPHRRVKLLENADYLRKRLIEGGFRTKGNSQIIPIMVGENAMAVAMSEFLKQKGYWVAAVRPPTVPKGEARIRLSLCFHHDREKIDKFIESVKSWIKRS